MAVSVAEQRVKAVTTPAGVSVTVANTGLGLGGGLLGILDSDGQPTISLTSSAFGIDATGPYFMSDGSPVAAEIAVLIIDDDGTPALFTG